MGHEHEAEEGGGEAEGEAEVGDEETIEAVEEGLSGEKEAAGGAAALFLNTIRVAIETATGTVTGTSTGSGSGKTNGGGKTSAGKPSSKTTTGKSGSGGKSSRKPRRPPPTHGEAVVSSSSSSSSDESDKEDSSEGSEDEQQQQDNVDRNPAWSPPPAASSAEVKPLTGYLTRKKRSRFRDLSLQAQHLAASHVDFSQRVRLFPACHVATLVQTPPARLGTSFQLGIPNKGITLNNRPRRPGKLEPQPDPVEGVDTEYLPAAASQLKPPPPPLPPITTTNYTNTSCSAGSFTDLDGGSPGEFSSELDLEDVPELASLPSQEDDDENEDEAVEVEVGNHHSEELILLPEEEEQVEEEKVGPVCPAIPLRTIQTTVPAGQLVTVVSTVPTQGGGPLFYDRPGEATPQLMVQL